MILTHEGIYDSIFMLDSGSDPNVIGSNILDKLNLTPTKSNSSLSIVSGGKMTQVDTYIVKSSIRNRLQITNFNTKIKKTRNKNSFFLNKIIFIN